MGEELERRVWGVRLDQNIIYTYINFSNNKNKAYKNVSHLLK